MRVAMVWFPLALAILGQLAAAGKTPAADASERERSGQSNTGPATPSATRARVLVLRVNEIYPPHKNASYKGATGNSLNLNSFSTSSVLYVSVGNEVEITPFLAADSKPAEFPWVRWQIVDRAGVILTAGRFDARGKMTFALDSSGVRGVHVGIDTDGDNTISGAEIHRSAEVHFVNVGELVWDRNRIPATVIDTAGLLSCAHTFVAVSTTCQQWSPFDTTLAYLQKADAVVKPVTGWEDLTSRLNAESPARVGSIRIIGHGLNGTVGAAQGRFDAASLTPETILAIQDRLGVPSADLILDACNLGSDTFREAAAIAQKLNRPVVINLGYTWGVGGGAGVWVRLSPKPETWWGMIYSTLTKAQASPIVPGASTTHAPPDLAVTRGGRPTVAPAVAGKP